MSVTLKSREFVKLGDWGVQNIASVDAQLQIHPPTPEQIAGSVVGHLNEMAQQLRSSSGETGK